jgi:cell division septation protein DedD
MITIRPSTIEENAPGTPESGSDIEEHKKRIPLIWIPVTLGVGLLIAAIYLGSRMVSVTPHANPAPAHVAATVNPRPPAPAPPTPAPQITTAAPADVPKPNQKVGPELPAAIAEQEGIPMITPRAGERYIQVGALNAEATRRMVRRLRENGLEPHVAPGPKPELMRVLIGPFNDLVKMFDEKKQLEAAGVETFLRKY